MRQQSKPYYTGFSVGFSLFGGREMVGGERIWDRVLCSPDWPQTYPSCQGFLGTPDSQILGLQICATTPGLDFLEKTKALLKTRPIF